MTIFPDMMNAYLDESIIGRARAAEKITVKCHNIRDYSADKHRKTDEMPYGGGNGMVMTPQPIDDCFNAIVAETGVKPYFIYMSPQGKTLTQKKAIELSKMDNIVLLCGHYEGVDQRVLDKLCDEFLAPQPDYKTLPRVFYLWGHSYEFDDRNNWEVLEKFCDKMGGRSDVWYATNIEIYDYVQAYNSLLFSADGTVCTNLSSYDVYFEKAMKLYCVKSGETLTID